MTSEPEGPQEPERLGPIRELNLPRLFQAPKWDPERKREETRTGLAYALVGLLAVVSLLLILGPAFGWFKVGESKDLAVAVLSPLVAIVGTVLGFYFGGQKNEVKKPT